MGGYGALKLGLKHHDKFCSLHSHSGPLALLHRSPGSKPGALPADLRSVFGDDAFNGSEDPFKIVASIDHGLLPSMWIDCGSDDELLEQNRMFHKHLTDLRIPHESNEFPGGHTWHYWDLHVREALAFHAKNLQLKFDDRG